MTIFKLLFIVFAAFIFFTLGCDGQEAGNGMLLKDDGKVFPGYVLIAPMNDRKTYLIDVDGAVVHTWPSTYLPGRIAYLLEDGSILRTGRTRPLAPFRNAGGGGGLIQKISWEGRVLWEYKIQTGTSLSHHDIEPLPNGNVLVLEWNWLSSGRARKFLGAGQLKEGKSKLSIHRKLFL